MKKVSLQSFWGVDHLHQGVQDGLGQKVKRENVQDFVMTQDAYTLYKTAPFIFTENRVLVFRPLYQFQADPCDMQALAEHMTMVQVTLENTHELFQNLEFHLQDFDSEIIQGSFYEAGEIRSGQIVPEKIWKHQAVRGENRFWCV